MIEALTPYQLAMSAAILAIAYFVRGIAGFGSGLIAVPLLAFVLPFPLVVPLMILLDYLASLSQGMSNRSDVRWKEVVPLIPFSLIGVAFALRFLTQADALLLIKALGGFIIVYGLFMFSGFTPKAGAARGWGVLAGVSGGIIGTLFGTGGPFYVSYFSARGLEKAAFRATLTTMFLMDGAWRLVGYGVSGRFTPKFLVLVAASLPIMALFMYLGGHVHTKLSERAFQRGISVLLIGSGIALLMKSIA